MGDRLKIAKVMTHYWEEPCISGSKGSGTIFFSGCPLKCVYCQNYKISHEGRGREISVDELIDIFKDLEKRGVHNINLVTPTHYTDLIIEALDKYRPRVPIVYNCGGYEDVEMIKKLKDYIDIYLVDCKYFAKDLSLKYSKCPDYFDRAIEAIKEMRKNQPVDRIVDGIMKQGVIVRHLVLPTCTQDSIDVVNHLYATFGNNVIISLMSQYVPYYRANEYPEINRKLKKIEYTRVLMHLRRLGMDGYCQQFDSADTQYIPDF